MYCSFCITFTYTISHNCPIFYSKNKQLNNRTTTRIVLLRIASTILVFCPNVHIGLISNFLHSGNIMMSLSCSFFIIIFIYVHCFFNNYILELNKFHLNDVHYGTF